MVIGMHGTTGAPCYSVNAPVLCIRKYTKTNGGSNMFIFLGKKLLCTVTGEVKRATCSCTTEQGFRNYIRPFMLISVKNRTKFVANYH